MSFFGRIAGALHNLGKDEFKRDTIQEQAERVGDEPENGSIYVNGLSNRWKSFDGKLSTEAVARALQSAEAGDLGSQNALYIQMEERDPEIASALMTRRGGILGLDRVMLPAPVDEKSQKTARDIAEDTQRVLDEIYDLDAALIDMLDAIGKGFSVMEIMWRKTKDGFIDRLLHIDPRAYEFDRDSGALFLNEESSIGEPKKHYLNNFPFRFLIHHSKMRSGHPSRAGALRILTWMYTFGTYALKDLSVYCEIFGMPLRIGKYKPTATPGDKAQLATMLKQMANDAWAVISESTTIEFEEAINRGQEPFTAFLGVLRANKFLAILGQEGTNVTNKYGTKGDSEVKQNVRQDILEADCKQLENTLRWQLLYPIVYFRHGADAAKKFTPRLHFKYEPALNLAVEAETDNKVLIGLGLGRNVKKSAVANKYGWDLIDGADEPLVDDEFIQGPPKDPGNPGAPSGNNKPEGKGESKRQGDNEKRRKLMLVSCAMLLAKKFSADVERQQAAIDELGDTLLEQKDEAVQAIVGPLLGLVSEAKSYEELLEKVDAAYADLDSDQLQILLGHSMMMARLYGRVAVNERTE